MHPELWVEPRDAKPGDTITVHYAGDVESPRLDYSFDGWRQGGASQAYEDMGYRYFERASFVEGLAHWRLEVQVPEDANALDVRVVDLDGKASDEHHHGFVFPYLGPYLHYTPDVQPADGIVVSWEAATPSWGVVAWGTDPHPRNLVVGDTWDTLHHVPLTGLPADSEIYYQVYSPDGRKTKVHSFRTPGDPDDALQVLFLSDMQDDGTPDELWGAIAGEVSDRYGDADLMILPGDLAYSDEPGFWWMFFHRGRHLFAEVPMVAAVGNHDTPGKASNAADQDSFLRYLALDEPWYQVVWGGLRALVLSSEDSAGMELGSEQLTWAASALEEGWAGDERLDRWTFATWHHPPYDIGGRFAAQAEDYRDPTALFDSRVDWVLTGHEHIYQRFHPMRYVAELVDSYGLGEDQGVGYLVLPSAGNRTYTDVVQEGQEGADQRELVAFPELVDGQTDTPVAVGWAVADLTPESLELTVWGMGTKGEPEAATVREIFVQER